MTERLRPLSGLDAGFLYLEAAGPPMHVGSLMRLALPKRRGYDFHRALLAHVAERLPVARALRRVLRDAPYGLGHPMWTRTEHLDLEAHITRMRLTAPGSDAQLNALVARLHAQLLPRDRPLWQFVVVDGLASGEVALYTKIHHALLDGQGAVALAQALLDTQAKPAKIPAAAVASRATSAKKVGPAGTAARATLQQFAGVLRGLPATMRLAGSALSAPRRLLGGLRDAVSIAPRTPFNGQVGPRRSFAVTSLPLDEVKRVARGFGASLNDVVMTLCSVILRDHLLRRGALPEQALIAAMPVSLRMSGNTEANNQVSMVQCPLPTQLADPVAQLEHIVAATRSIKGKVVAFRDLIPTDFPGLAAPLWATGLSRLWARGRVAERLPPLANLVVSNVPGPPMHLYLAGAKLLHNWPVSIVTHGLALNITLQAYAGQLEIGVIACKDALSATQPIAQAFPRALARLAARLPA